MTEWTPEKEAAWHAALDETERLQSELDVTNPDHVALWLEANDPYDGDAWLAVQIVEAHERALRKMLGPDPEAYIAAARGMREALESIAAKVGKMRADPEQIHILAELCEAKLAIEAFDATLGEQ